MYICEPGAGKDALVSVYPDLITISGQISTRLELLIKSGMDIKESGIIEALEPEFIGLSNEKQQNLLIYARREAVRICAVEGFVFNICTGDYGRDVVRMIGSHHDRRALVGGCFIDVDLELDKILLDYRLGENGVLCKECEENIIRQYKR